MNKRGVLWWIVGIIVVIALVFVIAANLREQPQLAIRSDPKTNLVAEEVCTPEACPERTKLYVCCPGDCTDCDDAAGRCTCVQDLINDYGGLPDDPVVDCTEPNINCVNVGKPQIPDTCEEDIEGYPGCSGKYVVQGCEWLGD
jgi:hypothetical protein